MKHIKLVIEEKTLATISKMSPNTVTGIIYIQVGGKSFPENGWNDFVVVILGWWCRELIEFREGVNQEAELLFMDGSFAWYLRTLEGTDLIKIECVYDYTSKQPEKEIIDNVSLKETIEQVKDATRIALDYCRQHKIEDDASILLQKLYAEL